MQYVFRQQFGLYIDATLGDDYFRKSLRSLLDYARRVSGKDPGSLMEDIAYPGLCLQDPVEAAVEYLQSLTEEGRTWVINSADGSLYLVPSDALRKKPGPDDETKDLSCLIDSDS